MSVVQGTPPSPGPDTGLDTRRSGPLAVVGSQISLDEELFGQAFDRWVVGRIATYLKPYKRRIAIAVVSVLIFTFTQLAIPLVIQTAIDDALVLGPEGQSLLHAAVIAFFGIVTVNYIANHLQELIVGKVASHLMFDLRRAMFAHLQIVSMSFMDKTEIGRLMSRLQGDVQALQEFLESSIFAIGDFVLLAGIIIVLLALDLRLGGLTLLVVPVLFGVRIVWLPRARKAFLYSRENSSATNAALAESVHGVRAVQELGREDVNYELFQTKALENLRAQCRAAQFTNVLIPIVDGLTGLAMAVIVVFGGGLVLDRAMDVGVMVAFLFYVQRFFDPIRSLTIQYSIMQRAMAAGQRIFEVLDVPVDVTDRPDAINLDGHDGSIEFRDVTFGYKPDEPILQHISFRAEPGETVALVGPTGSGKTSIISLAHRFYDVWEGEIRVGGQNVRDVDQRSLGRHIALVLQEPYLFSGTIFENIRYATADATREEIIKAARAVGAHAFISALEHGYDTVLDQRGSNLSMGQRQMLSFARALVADTPILVLDEATANVDSYTELEIQRALLLLLEGRTAIIIAHRLATIRNADRIIVLCDGEIVETGTHEELMAAYGLYSMLYDLNHASFDDISLDDLEYRQ
ncbi:MAG: ABC transporter ATP-binding protein [Rhodobacteraceae bacterium]|nr:ABC transporter ATP-binding protein [Paracoccaceae bacterium]